MRLTSLIICTLIAGGVYAQTQATIKVRRAYMEGDPPLYLANMDGGRVETIGKANGGQLSREDLHRATLLYAPANYKVISFRLTYGSSGQAEEVPSSFPTFNEEIRDHLLKVNRGDTVKFSDIIIQAPDGTMILYRKMTYTVEPKRT